MLVYQFLVLGLFLVSSSDAWRKKAPAAVAPAPDPLLKKPGLLSRWISSVKARFNRIFGRLDAKSMEDIYYPLFDQTNKALRDPFCVEGFIIDVDHSGSSLRLTGGKTGDLKVLAQVTKVLSRRSGIATGSITFVIQPSPIIYDFEFSASGKVGSYNKHGNITLEQNGNIHLEYVMQIPQSLRKIAVAQQAGKCIAKLKTFQTNIHNKPVVCSAIQYESKLKISEGSIRDVLNEVETELKKSIETAIVHKIDTVFRAFNFNCGNPEYTIELNPNALKNSEKCDFHRKLYLYKS